MKVELKTHDHLQYLCIDHITARGFSLTVDSKGYRGSTDFYNYLDGWLDNVISQLKIIEDVTSGNVKIDDVEGNKLQFRIGTLGSLEVTGEIDRHDVPRQSLIFGFVTDQTVLKPFISDFEKALLIAKTVSTDYL